MSALRSITKRIPLPIRDGLNPSHAKLPPEAPPTTAHEFITRLIETQRYRNADDDAAAIDARFAAGEVVDSAGRPYGPNDLVNPGADVWFYRVPVPEKPVPYDIPIIYQDEDLVVVDKPPFLATFPRASHITETVLVRLRRTLNNNELSPAHRLDRLTSGVLMLTARPEVRGAYQELFARREVHKVYEAIAPYQPHIEPGMQWRNRLEKTHGDIRTRIADGEVNAITDVDDVQKLSPAEQAHLEAIYGPQPPLARYRLYPLTGRTHQLRVHLWMNDAPILGDPVYPTVLPEDAEDFRTPMLLLSQQLRFTDPLTHQPRVFRSARLNF